MQRCLWGARGASAQPRGVTPKALGLRGSPSGPPRSGLHVWVEQDWGDSGFPVAHGYVLPGRRRPRKACGLRLFKFPLLGESGVPCAEGGERRGGWEAGGWGLKGCTGPGAHTGEGAMVGGPRSRAVGRRR